MSRPSLQWCKLYSRLLDDEDFRGMGLAERGVYIGLLCHANRQDPRGTFSIKNMRDLANVVADGNEAVLRSTLNYLCVEWLNIEGAPHLVREGDRLRFRTFEDIQRAPSEEPAAIKARKESFKERKNGNRTEIERGKNGQERSPEGEGEGDKEEIDEGVLGGEAGAEAPVVAYPSDIDPRVFEVLDVFGFPRSANNVKYVGLKIVEHPGLNPVSEALETKQHIATSKKPYKRPLVTWANWMKNSEKPPPWAAQTTTTSNSESVDVPMTQEELYDYIAKRTPDRSWQIA